MKKLIVFALVLLVACPAFAAMDFKDLKFTGHYRLRGYNVINADNNEAINDLNRFYRQRIWLGVEGTVAENILASVTLEHEDEWGKTNAINKGDLALVYGYVKIDKFLNQPLTLTVGRQPYQLNKNNFVLWDNANGLDGMRLNYATGDYDFDALYLKTVEGYAPDINDEEFYGVIGAYKGIKENRIQGYILLDRDANGNLESDLKRYIGLRGEGNITSVPGLSYIAEYINLGGDNGADVDYKSSLMYLCAGYEIKDAKGLKLVLDYLSTSGDNDATDNKDFQKSKVSGNVMLEGNINFDWAMDAFAASSGYALANLKAIGLGASLKPTDKLFVGAKYQTISNSKDNGGPTGKKVGNSFELVGSYQLGKNYYVCAGYTMFDPSNEYKAAPADEKTQVLAAEFRVNF